jgi:hypothetical protein
MVINLSPSRIDDALKCKAGKMTVAELSARLVGLDAPNEAMRLGTVCHGIAEKGQSFPPGPAQIDGFTLSAEAVEYIRSIPSLYAASGAPEENCVAELKDGVTEVYIRGRIDLLTPTRIVDYKFGSAKMWHGLERRWRESTAWKAYSLACGRKPCTYHYVQMVPSKSLGGVYVIGDTATVEFTPTNYTAGELFCAAIEAHQFMEQHVPENYANYKARKTKEISTFGE